MRTNKFSISRLRGVHVSSNINEVIRTIWIPFIIFFKEYFTRARSAKRQTSDFLPLKCFFMRIKMLSFLGVFACLFDVLCFLCVWNLLVKKKKNRPDSLVYITTLLNVYFNDMQISIRVKSIEMNPKISEKKWCTSK